MPGHTPGHTTLQLKLENAGPILLSGDLYHLKEARQLRTVPSPHELEGHQYPPSKRYKRERNPFPEASPPHLLERDFEPARFRTIIGKSKFAQSSASLSMTVPDEHADLDGNRPFPQRFS
ncbi:MAG TPA: hypothetical protein DIV79_14645 [Opitutae bacterium]|nr:hypothetical protein [Opitutae bacterium]